MSEKTLLPLTRTVSASLGGEVSLFLSLLSLRNLWGSKPILGTFCSFSCHTFPHFPSGNPSSGVRQPLVIQVPDQEALSFPCRRKEESGQPGRHIAPAQLLVCDSGSGRGEPPVQTKQDSNKVETGSQAKDTARGASTPSHL